MNQKTSIDPNGAQLFAMTPAAGAAGEGYWLRGLAFNEEAARFIARRAERYRSYFTELAGCRTPADVYFAASRAAQTCMSDYVDEATRVSEIALASPEEAAKLASEPA